MGNPYAPRTRRRNGVREPIPSLPVERLARLGASPRVLQEATDRWQTTTEEEKYAVLEELAQLTDDELIARIKEMEDELSGVLQGVVNAEIHVPKGSIAKVTDWVGSDPGRARLALDQEHRTGKPRQKLLGILEPLVGN